MDYTRIILPMFDFLSKFVDEHSLSRRFITREVERQFKEIVADLNRPKITDSFEFKFSNKIYVRITLPQGLERNEYDAIIREVAHKQLQKLPPSISEKINYGYTLVSYQLKLSKLEGNKQKPFVGVRWL
ncbi:hypothetical protein Kuja_0620 [Vibrio phage vB_VchM_Kuja]|uniref:Uncharacterized protein n=1 Tax=Vibrio phage vB_VchM_Kuja TaxID=2686437 RepID=A0A6B9J939_9CAUD|nr:hypothetical protein HWC83_gp174 [Vibrio phage vB_VchM_Kuja]QGZ16053.1 hypothetical protein Kuja_0620 [Vibrio phage vB_VchM_Kuja]